MTSILQVEQVRKSYGQEPLTLTHALNGINFTVDQGEFVAIMGPSGSGKTTLLNILAGLEAPTEGRVKIDGQSLAQLSGEALAKFRRTQLGFVFQDYNLLDTLTLEENVALPLLLAQRSDPARVVEVMKLLGISELTGRFPYQVSGGQQQRTAVARAIVHRPSVVLADEPSGNLDSKAATALLNQFVALNEQLQVTIVLVTHDPRAASYASRIIFVKDGRLHEELHRQGSPQSGFYDQILTTLSRLEEVTNG